MRGGAPLDRRVPIGVPGQRRDGVGKTTLLAALLGLVDPTERLVLVEDASELRPAHPHVLGLEARPPNIEGAGEITLNTLVRQALRMRPDRLVVGEVRGAEVVDMLAALNTGHAGGCGTLHANSARDVPARIEALAAAAGLPREAAHSQLASALDAVVHVARATDGRRHVAQVGVPVRSDAGTVSIVAAVEFGPEGRMTRGPASAPAGGSDRLMMLAAALAGVAAWLLVPSAQLTTATWTWRPLLISIAGAGGWGVVNGWLPARAGVLVVAGVLGAVGGRLIWKRRRDRRVRATTAVGVLDACEVLAAELAAGRPPGHALAEAARRWSGLVPVVDAWSLGSDVPGALRRVAVAPGAGDLRVVAAAWQVAHHSGSGLAHAVSRVASRIRAQRQTQRVVTSELASARATARLVAALPVVALGMGSGAGGSPWRFLLDTPVGWGCLVAGLAFGVGGLWWIEAIADQADPG